MGGGRLLFFGGNGHCAWRLHHARAAAAALGLTIDDVRYPGSSGRARAASLDDFLEAVADSAEGEAPIYATGIGGLIALCLRARGRLRNRRLLLQAPVLWGLERRVMPRLLRSATVRGLARRAFALPPIQGALARRFFRRRLSFLERAQFFEGYLRSAGWVDLFAWLAPSVLRDLEARFSRNPAALEHVDVWWGKHDAVVTLDELRVTEKTLGLGWPLRVFTEWGHYPMIDEPGSWAAETAAWLRASRGPGPP